MAAERPSTSRRELIKELISIIKSATDKSTCGSVGQFDTWLQKAKDANLLQEIMKLQTNKGNTPTMFLVEMLQISKNTDLTAFSIPFVNLTSANIAYMLTALLEEELRYYGLDNGRHTKNSEGKTCLDLIQSDPNCSYILEDVQKSLELEAKNPEAEGNEKETRSRTWPDIINSEAEKGTERKERRG